MKDFAALILTHGRPDRVHTYKSLRKHGYTGDIFIVIDNQDKKRAEYEREFGDQVIVFDKDAIAKTFDQGDNFNDKRSIIYARNASFEVARMLGLKYFIQLDDDYTLFIHRFDNRFDYRPRIVRDLDSIFSALLRFYERSGAASIAIAQGGDFIGGENSNMAQAIKLKRKCMNSFICSTDRPFKFVGRINEDVNTYTHLASKGLLLLTTNQLSLDQLQTQSNAGGMTELYLDSGTYIKSFYSVMYQPSSVKIKPLKDRLSARLHHSVAWNNTVPKIVSESLRKARE